MKKNGFELTASITSLALTIVAIILFGLSYTTGYYTFGQMQSRVIAAVLAGALVADIASVILRMKLPDAAWPKFIIFVAIALLSAGAMLLVGDRVEGIGNCIVTDYDSGHGGEEAIYLSLAASILMLAAVIYNVIGSFSREKSGGEPHSKKRTFTRTAGFGISAAAVLLAVMIPTCGLVWGGISSKSDDVSSESGSTSSKSGDSVEESVYTISFNQNNNNATDMPDYQFLCTDMGGLVKADSRMYVDVTLTLDGNGGYTLFTDAYVMDSGNRAVIGDTTGVGMILTTNAEGTYVENADGTVTTSVPVHAVFEMETDTYSAQIKSAFNLNVNGNSEDGVYDSNDEPTVFNFIPETVWILSGSDIVTYYNPGGERENGEESEETEENVDTASAETLTVASDDGSTSMTFNPDGTYLFAFEAFGVEDPGTYTYEGGKLTITNANGNIVEAEGDPLKLHYVSAVNEQLIGDFTVAAADLEALLDHAVPANEAEPVTVTSEDGGTTMTFNPDGTYLFAFEAYGVEDPGTYTYEGGKLTITNANGDTVEAEGDPVKLHYVSSMSNQLTGDFSILAEDLTALSSQGSHSDGDFTVSSEDGSTSFTFNADGTYRFAFDAYGVEDFGDYSYDGRTLTIINANGNEITATGDPFQFHYVSSMSDQLTGDFSVPAASFQ